LSYFWKRNRSFLQVENIDLGAKAQAETTEVCDVAIVGAGPAGAACALALKGSGLRVVLIDKGKFPRTKICGDAIPGPAMRLTRELSGQEERVESFLKNCHRIGSSVIYSPDGRRFQMDWKTEAYNITRSSFDAFLLDLVRTETNTQIVQDTVIDSIEEPAKGQLMVKGKGERWKVQASVVIGCDGANSVVARGLRSKSIDKKVPVAIRAYYENVDSAPELNEFFILRNVPGYFWIFPVGDGLYNVGIGLSEPYQKLGIDLKTLLRQEIEENEHISTRFKHAKAIGKAEGFKLPLWTQRHSLSGHRKLLCGDAAHLIDPLQGHGIDKAMQSAVLAAEKVKACFSANRFDVDFMSTYDKEVAQKLGKALERNLSIMQMLYKYPKLINVAFGFGNIKWVKAILQKYS